MSKETGRLRYAKAKTALESAAERLRAAGMLDSLNAVTAGIQRIAALEAELQAKWIDVNERLPERETFSRSISVLAHCPENICTYTATYDRDKKIWEHFGGHCGNINKKVSHWQPLPAPPEHGGQGGE